MTMKQPEKLRMHLRRTNRKYSLSQILVYETKHEKLEISFIVVDAFGHWQQLVCPEAGRQGERPVGKKEIRGGQD